jgi:hypothetical protein
MIWRAIMSRKIVISLMLVCLMSLMVSAAYAQDGPRPTPTDIGPTQPEVTPESGGDKHGTVRGHVYLDVNGDGRCVNTGVAGEEPVMGISIEFVSSDEKHVINHTSGENGSYELAGAGLSNWRVTAQPDAEWVVTSENPQYALVAEDNLAASDVNICVAKAGTAVYPTAPLTFIPADGDYVMPEAGAPASTATTTLLPIVLGLGLVAIGLVWRFYEISRK